MSKNQQIEANLLAACKKGDRKAQRYLYDQYKVYLYGVCLRYAKTKVEAEDILQEGFFRIFRDLHQYKGQGAIQAWMRKVMVNTALMNIRKYRKVKFSDIEEVKLDHAQLVDLSFSQKDRADAVICMIQALPDPYQTVFNLKAIEGYSFKEISQQLDVKEVTLRTHFMKARQKLQAVLKNELE